MTKVTLDEILRRYCERQDATADGVSVRLSAIASTMEVSGWMLLECAMLDGSRLGELTILPFGPGCTFKAIPGHPVSPRGLASDMSTVVAWSDA